MRGEELLDLLHLDQQRELPPHARRRVLSGWWGLEVPGITSACAEKRPALIGVSCSTGNYLRMRGEETESHPPFS